MYTVPLTSFSQFPFSLVLILTYLLSMFLYLFSAWEISLSLCAFNINDTFGSFLSVFLLSTFSMNKLDVCFTFNTFTSNPLPPVVLSVSCDFCLLGFVHPRAFTPSSEFISVLSLSVTVPSPFSLSFVEKCTV